MSKTLASKHPTKRKKVSEEDDEEPKRVIKKPLKKKKKEPKKDETKPDSSFSLSEQENRIEPEIVAIKECYDIRKVILETCGFGFPFEHQEKSNAFVLLPRSLRESISSWEFSKQTKVKEITLETGQYCYKDSKDLFVVKKVAKETSQGTVYVVDSRGKGFGKKFIILKSNVVNNQNNFWIGSTEKERYISSSTDNTKYRVIGSSYMDALCGRFFSDIVECRESIHFPLVYGTTINKIKKSKDGEYVQLLWMEYLPFSLFDVLRKESDVRVWWSCLFQVTAALCLAQERYGMIHNDLHAENSRVRKVDKDAVLWYKYGDVHFKVKTYGLEVVIIDFGRSLIKPWGAKKLGLVSSEFCPGGQCRNMIVDNTSIDLVRLCSSIDDITSYIKPKEDREAIRDFFMFVCKTDNGEDWLNAFYTLKEGEMNAEFVDTKPRRICHNAIPKDILKCFVSLFQTNDKPPDGQIVYSLV